VSVDPTAVLSYMGRKIGPCVVYELSIGIRMRGVVFVATAVVVWAGVVGVSVRNETATTPQLLTTTALTAATVIQRVNGVHKWLSGPKNRRRQQLEVLAQQTLLDVCRDRPISSDVIETYVHVWEVPLWYRRLFPYVLRSKLKEVVQHRPFNNFEGWVIRPSLNRVAAVGFVKPAPSGVRFRKGVGLVGVCVANNDRAQVITLNTESSTYHEALKSDELTWQGLSQQVTHELSLSDAQRLARSYGQVIGKIVQDMDTGEAIGCVTISAKNPRQPLQLDRHESCRRKLNDLAMSSANVLA
jgi:hypothetical protein